MERIDRKTFELLEKAKKTNNFNTMQYLFDNYYYNDTIRYEYAKMLVQKGRFVKARNILTKMIDNPSNSHIIFELGRLERLDKNYDESKKHLTRLLCYPNKNYAKLELGKLEYDFGNYDEARKYFTSLLNESNKLFAKLELGKLEVTVGNYDAAKKILMTLFAEKNRNNAKIELGRMNEILGNYKEARDLYLAGMHPTTKYDILNRLAELELKFNHREEAYKYYLELYNCTHRMTTLIKLILLCIKNNDIDKVNEYSKILIANYSEIPNDIKLYLSKTLNIYFKNYEYKDKSYNANQFIDYDEYSALEYVLESQEKQFNPDIDVVKLFKDVQNDLTNENLSSELQLNDIYDIPYENIGNNNESVLRVITTPNTKNILTLYPLKNNR